MARRFLLHLALGTAVLAGGVALFNGLVDPFTLRGGTDLGPPGRVGVVWTAASSPRDTLLLGTSRVRRGFAAADVAAWLGPTQNAAVPGCSMVEAALQARYLSRAGGARTLVLGLDLGMFLTADPVRPGFEEERLRAAIEPGPGSMLRRWRETLWSREATVASLDVLFSRAYEDPTPRRPGRPRPLAEMVRRWSAGRQGYATQMEALRALLDDATPRAQRVRLFVNPHPASHHEALHAAGLGSWSPQWRGDLVEACAAARRQGLDVELWDFSPPLEPAGDLAAFPDGSHFTPQVGRRLLARMGGGAEGDGFGLRLDERTRDAVLDAIARGRAAWAASHPADVREIAALVPGEE